MYLTQWRKLSLLFTLFSLSLFTLPVNAEQEKLQNPILQIVGNGPLVPQSDYQSLPINFMNLKEVDIEVMHITDPNRFLNQYYLTEDLKSWQLDNIKHDFVSVYSERVTLPDSKENEQTSARIPLPHTLASGWYLVVLKSPGEFYNIKAKHLLLTDISIQAKLNLHQASFTATRLSSGQAVNSGIMEIYRDGKLLKSAPIDPLGNAYFDIETYSTDTVIARVAKTPGSNSADQSKQKEEIGILPLRESPLDLSDYAIGGREYQPYEAFIYSNRDMVKPDETLPLNILLRNQDGETTTNQDVTLTLLNPYNDVMLTEQLSPQAAGYYSKQLQTSIKWPTGRYTAQVRLNPKSDKPIGQFTFNLEEFVPERMDLTFTDPAKFALAGNLNTVQLNGRYLFGSPANGNLLYTSVTYSPQRHFEGKFSQYFVGVPFRLNNNYTELEDVKMSEQGTASVAIPTSNPNSISSPVKVQANFSLLEDGGAAVQRSLAFTSWKNSPIPAIRPHQFKVGYHTSPDFDIALLSPDGQSMLDGDIQLDYEREQWPYYWYYEDDIGWKQEKQDKWKHISTQTIKVTKGNKKLITLPSRWGDYRITLTDKKSGNITQYSFYAGWYDESDQVREKPEHLNIKLDKTAYIAGDNIGINLNSPIDGSAAITLETDETIRTQRVAVKKGQSQLSIILPKEIKRHDIYLTVTLTGNENHVPKRYFGITAISLDRQKQKLAINAPLPRIIKPLTKVTVPVSVDNITATQQNNTWVTLSLVDKGIINLSRFTPVNPFDYFYGQRRYSADIIDLYSRLFDLRPDPFAQSHYGSDAVDNTDNKNDNLVESKSIILMTKPVKLVNGKANIELDIPDYNGEGQLIVTAFNDNQSGQLVKNQTITSPVVAELSIPRFLIPGDKPSVTVDIHNNSGNSKTLTLVLTSSAAIVLDQSILPAQITLKDKEHVSFNIPFSVINAGEYKAKLTLDVNETPASEDDVHISRSWQIPVHSLMPWATTTTNDVLSSNSSRQVPSNLWYGMQTVQQKLGYAYISQLPTLSIAKQARDLFRYPYGCAEQTTSKAMPYLLSAPELDSFKLAVVKDSQHSQSGAATNHIDHLDRDMLSKAITTLQTMQYANGGFSLWSLSDNDDYNHELPWLTVYVTDFLIQADKRFANLVPEDMLHRATIRVYNYIKDPSIVRKLTYSGDSASAVLTYGAYLLANKGMLQWSEINNLNIDSYPSPLSYLQQISAYAAVGDSGKALTMLDNYANINRKNLYFHDYGSNIRDKALAVVILEQLRQNPQLQQAAAVKQAELLDQLIKQENRDYWLSTQEQGALLQAAVISHQHNNNQQFSVEIDGKVVSHQGAFSVPLTKDTLIKNLGQTPIHLKWQAQGYIDQNIANNSLYRNTLSMDKVQRQLFTPDGKPFDGDHVKVGDKLIVLLTVKSRSDLYDMMLTDKIPAGFVLENPSISPNLNLTELLPNDTALSKPQHTEYRNDRFVVADSLGLYDNPHQYAYVIRAEVPGTFIAGAIYIEAMYQPQEHSMYWFAPGTFTIEK